MSVKPCCDCGDLLPLARFPRHRSSNDGRASRCQVCTTARRKQTRDPARERDRRLRRAYGITSEDYRSMGATQGWRCPVCGEGPASGGRLVVDHDHVSGLPRGLLHSTCNAALGLLADDPAVLERAAAYLSRTADLRAQVLG
ncbi:endonuclease VII domain-containing protein [Streptomyces sp. UNOB3_S3]|uniref:endonuclease VII domain-containing protein n=1 Tax=Streptomyces sp. UNOB3_S3 TaxID=2871682 RepID=UPI001E330AB1|nr:endonuclease VII domain-containing protein [Streptomyces sp. UNOB3_S3]MCC3773511.1 endonuclease VII domain-containing protein [Streptomyces sp. UNOB3_S3]